MSSHCWLGWSSSEICLFSMSGMIALIAIKKSCCMNFVVFLRCFHGMLFFSYLIILPMYLFVLLMMKVSIFGLLLKWFLTSSLVILSSLTHSHLSPSILLIALWWKPLSLLMFLAVMFHDSHPQRRVLRGPAVYTQYLSW